MGMMQSRTYVSYLDHWFKFELLRVLNIRKLWKAETKAFLFQELWKKISRTDKKRKRNWWRRSEPNPSHCWPSSVQPRTGPILILTDRADWEICLGSKLSRRLLRIGNGTTPLSLTGLKLCSSTEEAIKAITIGTTSLELNSTGGGPLTISRIWTVRRWCSMVSTQLISYRASWLIAISWLP